jgi:ribosomal protein S18 acetylase RimI-like enzyme
MAPTDSLPLSVLAEGDMAACMSLSAEAGWNQTPDDWALFMQHGAVLGLPDKGGHPVATGAILPYPTNFAWISMVLVTARRRRQRIGTRILQTCCAAIVRRGLVAILDATPAGERVYRPLGFEPMFRLTRWQGEGGAREGGAQASRLRAMTAADIPAVSVADAAAFGADRVFLLDNFFRRAPQLAFVCDDGSGFVLARPGRVATQIGPLVATREDSAIALLDAALDAASGPVFLDLADRWDGLAAEMKRRGFIVQRPFLRMGLHRGAPFGNVRRTFAIAGPEFG